ncbi:hypothetical protein HDU96_005324 [Phlyctochytrium bullatum]|nr:hypothetical protein HDU96_005324 [Phlyctochytrium bullatum]
MTDDDEPHPPSPPPARHPLARIPAHTPPPSLGARARPPPTPTDSSSTVNPEELSQALAALAAETATPNTTLKARAVPRLLIGFTCKVCNTRSHKTMTKQAYERGVVIIQCDGCKNRHLIADHLGWFDTTQGPLGTIEEIMARKGEGVVRLRYEAEEGEGEGERLRLVDGKKDAEGGEVGSGMMEWLPKQ